MLNNAINYNYSKKVAMLFSNCLKFCFQVRASSLQDLVYKSGQAGVTKATVTIYFDNTNKKCSPINYEQYDEITISRQVRNS